MGWKTSHLGHPRTRTACCRIAGAPASMSDSRGGGAAAGAGGGEEDERVDVMDRGCVVVVREDSASVVVLRVLLQH